MLYQFDLMLRGALFDFMEHTQRSLSPITINQNSTAFVYYTLVFRMFVAIYVISSLFRVLRFALRRWRALLRYAKNSRRAAGATLTRAKKPKMMPCQDPLCLGGVS